MNTPTFPPTRALTPDLARALALVGIAVVNVGVFSWPIMQGYHNGALASPPDIAAFLVVSALFTAKSYPLFAMMFGVGLAYQEAAATREGARFGPRYFRRLSGLYVIGLAHFAFAFIGDILMIYAVLGCFLFGLRHLSDGSLVRTGLILVALNAGLILLIAGGVAATEAAGPAPTADADSGGALITRLEQAAFSTPDFWAAAAARLKLLPAMQINGFLVQGLSVLGFMMIGLAAARSGLIARPEVDIWRSCRKLALPAGLAGSMVGAWLMADAPSSQSSAYMFGTAVLFAFSPFAALGYLGLVARISAGAPGPVRRFLARAGGASLSAYLLQSLILSLAFSAYGWNLYARLGALDATLLGLGAGAASVLAMGLLRTVTSQGPVEFVLRLWTYLHRR